MGTIVFVFVAFPIWVVIDCIKSKEKSNGSKIFWIILTFLTSTLGAIIYSFLGSTNKTLRRVSIYVTIFGVLAIVGFLTLIPWLSTDLTNNINQSLVVLRTVDTTALSPEELEVIRKDLNVLSTEAKFDIRKNDQLWIAHDLVEYFQLISQDRKIDKQEYQDWSQKFELRKILKQEEFEKLIEQKRSAQVVP